MGADLRALVGIEEALEQGAENRRVDQAPVEAGGGEQEADFGLLERQRRAAVEQAAVEFAMSSRSKSPPFAMSSNSRVETCLGLRRLALGRLQAVSSTAPFGSSPTLSAKKQNTS